MKYNLGCGNKKLDGFINLDKDDIDLNILPYKFVTNSIDYILLSQVFEHLDADKRLGILDELLRVTKKDGLIEIGLPTNSYSVNHITHIHNKGYFNIMNLNEKYLLNAFEIVDIKYTFRGLKSMVYQINDIIRRFLFKDITFFIKKR